MIDMLGSTVQDIATGYKGLATERVESMAGHVRYCVEGKVGADGKMPRAAWLDDERLKVVESGE